MNYIVAAKKNYPGVGERLRARRTELGLSQRELAGPGVTYAYISRIENGRRRPSLDVVISLAEKLQVSPLWLLFGAEHMPCPLCGASG